MVLTDEVSLTLREFRLGVHGYRNLTRTGDGCEGLGVQGDCTVGGLDGDGCVRTDHGIDDALVDDGLLHGIVDDVHDHVHGGVPSIRDRIGDVVGVDDGHVGDIVDVDTDELALALHVGDDVVDGGFGSGAGGGGHSDGVNGGVLGGGNAFQRTDVLELRVVDDDTDGLAGVHGGTAAHGDHVIRTGTPLTSTSSSARIRM